MKRVLKQNRDPWSDAERNIIARPGLTERQAVIQIRCELGIVRSASTVGRERLRVELEQLRKAAPAGYYADDGVMLSELLRWTEAAQLPDADMTVLMWIAYSDGTSDWAAGWWDGECWRDAATGGKVFGSVTHWAEPAGPRAC